MNSEIRKMFCDLLGEDRVFTEEAMSQHTTFKIGGPADYFLMPDKGEDVGRVIKICKEKEIPYFILGNGSNLLVGDGGYRGAVIQIYRNMSSVTVEGNDGTGRCIAFGCGSCRQKCFTYRLRVCGRDSGNDRRRGCDECRGLWW